MWWIYVLYVVALVALVYLSIKLGDYVDLFDKKTKVSGALLGGVLLAGVTSLPELFTSISSVLMVRDASLVVGDILGSDIFDLMVLVLFSAVFFKSFPKAKISSWQIWSSLTLIVLYGMACYALLAPESWQPMLGDINALSILIMIVYILILVFQPKEKEEEEAEELEAAEEAEDNFSLKKTIILFSICAVLLIGTSIGITYLTDAIVQEIDWLGSTVAGAILLGIATSLPEVISTITLFRKGNFDTGYGNMIGSCTFNFSILALADFISWHQVDGEIISPRGIFILNSSSYWLVIFGIATAALTLGIVLLKNKTKIFEKKGVCLPLISLAAAGAVAMYVLTLALK